MTGNNTLNQTLATIVGTSLAVGTISSIGWWYYYTRFLSSSKSSSSSTSSSSKPIVDPSNNDSISNINSGDYALLPSPRQQQHRPSTISNYKSQQFKPPFPTKIRIMLSKCRLAYLSTVDSVSESSHLSLMRFTYVCDPSDGEVIVMSTNRKTKKFHMLTQQRGVALLVHDFVKIPTSSEDEDDDGDEDDNNNNIDNGGTYSMTLNGQCHILDSGSVDAERYRSKHLQHNPDYPQFIVGPDIVMLRVDVTSARICDVQDQVTKWNVQDGYQ